MHAYRPCSRLAGLHVGVVFALALAAAPALRAQLVNGSFEAGRYRGWGLSGSVWGLRLDGDEYRAGLGLVDYATAPSYYSYFPASPGLPITPTATDGRVVALQLQRVAGTHVLYQDLTLDGSVSTLSWDMQYANHAGGFVAGVQDVELTLRDPDDGALLPGGDLFSLAGESWPQSSPMTSISREISSFQGQTVRIRLAIHNQNGSLDCVLDNFETDTGVGDYDADGVLDDVDNCREAANADQGDHDGDGLGDLCDNCPRESNSSQEDADSDGVGDACESDEFRDGEIYILSLGFPSGDPFLDPLIPVCILEVDPVTGVHRIHHRIEGGGQMRLLTHDPFRDELILKFRDSDTDFLYVNAQGEAESRPIGWRSEVIGWGPGGDGRIFLIANGDAQGRILGYLDENDQAHDLLDSAGAPFRVTDLNNSPGGQHVLYDLGTNSIFLAYTLPGGRPLIRKIPLVPDGTRAAGPGESLDLGPLFPFAATPQGLSAGPDGAIFICADMQGGGTYPHMLLVDPVTLTSTTWSLYPRALRANMGTYNSLTGRGVTEGRATSGPRLVVRTLRAYGPSAIAQEGDILQTMTTPTSGGYGFDAVSIGDTVNRTFRLELSMEGLEEGGTVYGVAGQTVRLEGSAFMSSAVAGVTNWELGIRAEGASVALGVEPCDAACAASTIFKNPADKVAASESEVVDPGLVPPEGPLAGAPQGVGLLSRVVLTPGTELGSSRVRVLRFRVDVTVPDGPEGEEVRIFFGDGLQGTESPVLNSVTLEGETFTFGSGVHLGETTFSIRDAERLEYDTTTGFTLSPDDPLRVFRLDPPVDRFLLLNLSDPDQLDANAIYFSQGTSLVPGSFEIAADGRFQANQRLAAHSLRDEPVFVEVRGTIFKNDLNELSLANEGKNIALERVSAPVAATGASRRLTESVLGAGFDDTVTLSLVPQGGGAPLRPAERTVVSSRRIEARFSLEGQAPGVYDVVAELPGGESDTLEGAVVLVAGGVGPVFEASLTGVRAYRYNRFSRVTLRLRNAGDAELPAPLLKIAAPPGTELRLDRERQLHVDQMLVLGIDRSGVPRAVPPGAEIEIPVIFRLAVCPPPPEPCDESEPGCVTACDDTFRVSLLESGPDDLVGWDTLDPPAGVSLADWLEAWPELSRSLGASWSEVLDSLGELATRLHRRGRQAASVAELFRHAVREALGRPSSAVVGRLTGAGSGLPLAGRVVLALRQGEVVSSATTDGAGGFALEFLPAGEEITIAVDDHVVVEAGRANPLTIPAGVDVLRFDIAAQEAPDALSPACPNCDTSGLPLEPLFPPDSLFTPLTGKTLRIVNSWDPNDKGGPGELGSAVPGDESIEYSVFFENEAARASAPAQEVVVVDVIDPTKYDLNTFEVLDIRVGNLPYQYVPIGIWGQELTQSYSASPNQNRFFGSDSFTIESEFEDRGEVFQADQDITISWTFDNRTGRAEFRLKSDTDEALLGVLAINDEEGSGEGMIGIRILPAPDLAAGTDLENDAEIKFDDNPIIRTPSWRNTIQIDPPAVPGFPRPSPGATEVLTPSTLQWESALAREFDVYLWPTGGSRNDLLAAAIGERFVALPTGLVPGETYGWRVVARNDADEVEGPDWSFTVAEDPGPCPEDVPGAPIPANGAVGVALDGPALGWDPVPGAIGYSVFFHEEGMQREPLARGISGTELVVDHALERGRSYVWEVQALFEGNCVTTAGPWTFTAIAEPFRRGDANVDGITDISDAILALEVLFLRAGQLACEDAADANDDGALDIADPLTALFSIFAGTVDIPSPGPLDCGDDPTADGLDCQEVSACLSE